VVDAVLVAELIAVLECELVTVLVGLIDFVVVALVVIELVPVLEADVVAVDECVEVPVFEMELVTVLVCVVSLQRPNTPVPKSVTRSLIVSKLASQSLWSALFGPDRRCPAPEQPYVPLIEASTGPPLARYSAMIAFIWDAVVVHPVESSELLTNSPESDVSYTRVSV
jgi:hypothetical protein